VSGSIIAAQAERQPPPSVYLLALARPRRMRRPSPANISPSRPTSSASTCALALCFCLASLERAIPNRHITTPQPILLTFAAREPASVCNLYSCCDPLAQLIETPLALATHSQRRFHLHPHAPAPPPPSESTHCIHRTTTASIPRSAVWPPNYCTHAALSHTLLEASRDSKHFARQPRFKGSQTHKLQRPSGIKPGKLHPTAPLHWLPLPTERLHPALTARVLCWRRLFFSDPLPGRAVVRMCYPTYSSPACRSVACC
jgi:hypothetical protein